MIGDALSLVAPFFTTPTSYSQMLKKLAGLAFYEALLIVLVLRTVPTVDAWFQNIETVIPIGKDYNLGTFAVALLVALASHIFHLHDRISDLLGIRRRFDKNHILLPLARLVGVRITPRRSRLIGENRHSLMRDVFYRYASSRADQPLVDKHDIEHALGQWAWFWAFVECAVFFAVGSGIAFLVCSLQIGISFAVIVLISVLIAFVLSFRLPRYARPEIEAIANDRNARRRVRARFDAL